MKNKIVFLSCLFAVLFLFCTNQAFAAETDTIPPRHKVSLPQAHVGDVKIDTELLVSYILLPENIREFNLEARDHVENNQDAAFTDEVILKAAEKQNILLMGGPLLGQVKTESISMWLRPANIEILQIKVDSKNDDRSLTYTVNVEKPGKEHRIVLDQLLPGTEYSYSISAKNQLLAQGSFTTAPEKTDENEFRLTFGSCFHKIGLHNPNLVQQILGRKPNAMMLLCDLAVDDRENRVNMHRSDYLLRDVSKAWSTLAANLPLYSAWDDHDYFNNDLSGIPKGFTETDRDKVRQVWIENWNNPLLQKEGIYFNTRIGPVEIMMLDTRSCRDVNRRGEYGSYLGQEQLQWLKETLKKSDAPFKVLSSGTMWSDYVTNGKDSWGTWDTKVRKEIFDFIENEKIHGVLLVSGDRHGARGFTLPQPSGFKFYEFETACLGGVPGPDALAKDTTNQIFGYHGKDFVAFGEFTFETSGDEPVVTFRLIDQFGTVLEKHVLPYAVLSH